jgi:hypothetical protein
MSLCKDITKPASIGDGFLKQRRIQEAAGDMYQLPVFIFHVPGTIFILC